MFVLYSLQGPSPHVAHSTQELLQHAARPVTLPQMVVPNTSPLTTALNAPLVTPPTLAPLAALLNPEVNGCLCCVRGF